MNRPITPAEAAKEKLVSIPDVVFEVVNELLVQNLRSGYATIKQRDIVNAISQRDPEIAEQLFDKGWMDFEDAYRQAGWTVSYAAPGYNETYDAVFKFKAER